MASKRPHPQGPQDRKPKQSPAEKAEHRHEHAQQNQNQAEFDQSLQHRSGQSLVEGGENEQRGEPPAGYGTEAPQVQGGGKR
jgi:hypothetical protein